MNEVHHHDVIIVGSGMVGLSLALALRNCGLNIALIDERSAAHSLAGLRTNIKNATFDSRVSALTSASCAFLQALGVWLPLQELRVCPYQHMVVWDADGTGSIDFHAADLHADWLGVIAENSLVSAVLAQALYDAATVKIYQPETLIALTKVPQAEGNYNNILTLESGTSLHCKLVIGADGGTSKIRTLAGFETREWNYDQHAIVTTVTTTLPHQLTAWQRFMPTGPLAFLPLMVAGDTSQQNCSIVWSCAPALAGQLLALDDAEFAQQLEQAFESRLGKIQAVATRQAFPLRQLHALNYVNAGVALVGDAAHTIHPLAGQGVNLGFADAEALAAILKHAVARKEDFASLQILSRYQRQRKPANLGMMVAMEGFKRIFASDNLSLRWLRNSGLNAVNHLSPLKQQIMRIAMGLK